MLKFYGIRFNQQGLPERFTISFALKESLNASLYIHDYFHGDQEKTLNAIVEEINKQYHPSNYINKQRESFRQTAAKWFRTKDMTRFIFSVSENKEMKIDIARILNTEHTIEEKWLKIESIILKHISTYPKEVIDQKFSNSESDFNKILQMVTLFFLEQDEEMPPANLELQFVRNQFPKIVWKKRDGFNASSDPFWLPKNLFCRTSYLLTRIISGGYSEYTEQSNAVIPIDKVIAKSSVQTTKKSGALVEPITKSLMPQGTPDSIQIRFDNSNQLCEQLSFLPESVSETLLSLQKYIQKKYSHDGVKHFLGILRQISKVNGNVCAFSSQDHLSLVTKLSKEGNCTDRQYKIYQEVFQSLSKLQVNRSWSIDHKIRKVQSPFLLEIGKQYLGESSEETHKHLLLDPMFISSSDNPFRLGSHLQLIPRELFRESTHKHSLLTGLSSYLTGTWLNEYPHGKGVINKTAREIIEGCAFNITPSNKYRIRRKLNSELEYMEEKHYIGKFCLVKSQAGNPWSDQYRIEAPEHLREKLKEISIQQQERLCG